MRLGCEPWLYPSSSRWHLAGRAVVSLGVGLVTAFTFQLWKSNGRRGTKNSMRTLCKKGSLHLCEEGCVSPGFSVPRKKITTEKQKSLVIATRCHWR